MCCPVMVSPVVRSQAAVLAGRQVSRAQSAAAPLATAILRGPGRRAGMYSADSRASQTGRGVASPAAQARPINNDLELIFTQGRGVQLWLGRRARQDIQLAAPLPGTGSQLPPGLISHQPSP